MVKPLIGSVSQSLVSNESESATDEEGFDILGDGAGNDEDHG